MVTLTASISTVELQHPRSAWQLVTTAVGASATELDAKLQRVSRTLAPLAGIALLTAIVDSGAVSPARPQVATAGPPPSVLKARVVDYEARVASGTATPADLAALGETVVAAERASRNRAARVAACASTWVDRTEECARHLAAAAADDALPWRVRFMAAGARLKAGEPGAASLFERLAATAPIAELVTAIEIIRAMSPRHAIPPLLRMLASSDIRAQAAGCRALGDFDTLEVHTALQQIVEKHPAGTAVWVAATVSRARLGHADARLVMGNAHAYFTGEDLLGAAQALSEAGDSRAEVMLRLVTRQETGLVRLRAALLLSDSAPDVASRVLDSILREPDPQVRADALDLYRERALPLPPSIPRLLLDPAAMVRLRAAELAIAWAHRQAR
jgi:hypothetical protein